MRKLVCKVCGNDEFEVLKIGETLCKCGLRLTDYGDYLSKESKNREKEDSNVDQKQQAEMIARISLLKQALDKSLDKRNKKEFKRLTSELRLCQDFFKTLEERSQIRPKQELRQRQDNL